jgi:hypothetical protein
VRRLCWILAVLLVLAIGFALRARVTFDRAVWLADYDQLRRHMNRSYANLVDSVRAGRVDPVALHRRTLAALEAASTDRQARAVLEDFVAAFDDGHLRIPRVKLSKRLSAWWDEVWNDDAAGRGAGEVASADEACDAIGIRGEHRARGFASSDLPGFVALDDPNNSFRAGIVALDGAQIGVLRISSFDQTRYRAACLRAWHRRPRAEAPCDEACQDRLYHRGVAEQLLSELAARLDAFAARNIDLLAVDLTGNGGGREWSLPAARLFSSKPLACPRQAFIKHPHWTGRLRATLRDVERDLGGSWSDADRAILLSAQARLTRLLELAAEPCDLEPLWTTPGVPSCAHVVDDEHYACGVLPDIPAGALASAKSREALDHLLRYQLPATHPPPRIVVVINGRTASAAEMFAAMLIDNRVARAIGQRSEGVGCGYTHGGVPAILEHSGLRVEMPDCLRRRADGRNERFGIDPELPIAWSSDDRERRAQLLEALRRAAQQR